MKKILFNLTICLGGFLGFLLLAQPAKANPGAKLSLSPESGTFSSAFDVKVMLDTGGEEVIGAELFIDYEPTKLNITESSIKPGGGGLSVIGAAVDSTNGLIEFTAYNPSTKISGSAVHLATLTFTPKGSGSTDLTLKFTAGQTSGDCTVPKGGVDILEAVSGATYTLSTGGDVTHYECQDEACVEVSGAGEDECAENADCSTNLTHRECQAEACVEVEGEGDDECTDTADCVTPTHRECRNQVCVEVTGAGTDRCTDTTECQAASGSGSTGSGTSGGTSSGSGTGTTTPPATPETAGTTEVTIFLTLFALSLISGGIFLVVVPSRNGT